MYRQFYREEEMANYSEECDGPSCKLCAEYGRESDKDIWGSEESTDGNSGFVYLIKSEEGVPYVGTTTTSIEHRMAQHRYAINAGHGDGKKFTKYYQNHDFDKADIRVIDTGTSKEELRKKERKYIQKYDSLENGLNSQL